MSKELEETIKKLKWYKLYSGLGNGTCIVNIDDLEIALNYIENSIPKEKVEEILNNKYRLFFEGDAEFPDMSTRIDAVKYIKADVLQELLEGK